MNSMLNLNVDVKTTRNWAIKVENNDIRELCLAIASQFGYSCLKKLNAVTDDFLYLLIYPESKLLDYTSNEKYVNQNFPTIAITWHDILKFFKNPPDEKIICSDVGGVLVYPNGDVFIPAHHFGVMFKKEEFDHLILHRSEILNNSKI